MGFPEFRNGFLTEIEGRISSFTPSTATDNELLVKGALFKMAASVAEIDMLNPSSLRLLETLTSAQLNTWLGDLSNKEAFDRLLSDTNAFRSLLYSSTPYNTVLGSSSAMAILAANPTAITTVLGEATAFSALISNSSAFAAMIASTAALNAMVASATAMTAITANSTAFAAMIASTAALNAMVASATAMAAVAANSTAMTTVAASSAALTAIKGSATAISAINGSTTAKNALYSSPLKTVVTKTNGDVWNFAVSFHAGSGLFVRFYDSSNVSNMSLYLDGGAAISVGYDNFTIASYNTSLVGDWYKDQTKMTYIAC